MLPLVSPDYQPYEHGDNLPLTNTVNYLLIAKLLILMFKESMLQ